MNIIEAIIFGVVQGITEFVPVSSSGHLVVLHELFSVNGETSLSFDVSLHIGTLFALLVYFRKDLLNILRSFVNGNRENKDYPKYLAWLLLLGTIPATLIGFFYEEVIDSAFRTVSPVAVMLIIIGLLMLGIEKWAKGQRQLTDIKWLDSIIIGLAQAIALIPGTSRSGITIIAGMGLSLSRATAARFSFLLALPVIFGAGLKKFVDLSALNLNSEDISVWMIGIATAFIFGWIAIAWLLKYLTNHKLYLFAWYRIILGIILLLFFT
ncbi:undecaprenyl-diphosphatase UppP [Patescibacteria group bacterium]